MKKINIYYWLGSPDNNFQPNFGDILNPYMIEELSGLKAQYKNLSRKVHLYILMKLKWKQFPTIEWPWQDSIIAIGSIIDSGNKKSKIWGSGFMKSKDKIFKGGKTFAVRGKLTDKKLQDLGFPGCKVYGDPALLLPLFVEASSVKKFKLGIIPHWTEADRFNIEYGLKYKLIDLRTDNIKGVVQDITACEYILSTSLHGVIVAHAYGIPAIWIKEGDIHTDGFKFKDYFSSVEIPFYDGFNNVSHILENDQHWQQLFKENKELSYIHNSLYDIQLNLLKAAPFPLKSNYKNMITNS